MAFWNWKKKNTASEEVVEENIETGAETSEGQESFGEAPAVAAQNSLAETEENALSTDTAIAEQNADVLENIIAEPSALETTEAISEVVAETDENAEDEPQEEIQEEVPTKKGLFARLKEGLAKTRNNIVSGMDSLFSGEGKIDEDFYEELEEILILGDIGVHTTENILDKLRSQVKENHIKKRDECKEFLINTIKEEMASCESAYEFENKKSVVFVIGVNGVGKTTSIGKLAYHLKAGGRKVILAAADTFRAAAGSQLEEWSHRAGVLMIGGTEGQDPASVLFDAVQAAKSRNSDVLLVDTAGRLHNKKNLMEELKKMNRIIDKEYPDAHRENLIVLDASTGQNALNQAKEFGEVADLTGIILTKMDGTAKGGIAIAIESELGIPVKYVGVGEKIYDLQKFDADTFVDALFDVNVEEEV